MNQEADKELQRANEVFVLLEGCLPNGLKGKFDKVKNDPSPFPKQRPTCAHLRILPTIREVPEKFWDSTWCFYQLSVGSELAGSVACVDFRHAPGNAECGHGEHSAAVSRTLAATALRVNVGRKVRRGHGCDRAVQKCGIFMNNEACIALWKTGPTYGNGWPRAR